MQRPSRRPKRDAKVDELVVVDWEDVEVCAGWHSAAAAKVWRPPIVRSVGVVVASSKDKVVLAGDYSAPGDELNRLIRIPASMVRSVRTLEKKLYLGE